MGLDGDGLGTGWTWLWWLLLLAGLAAVIMGLVQAGRVGRGAPADRRSAAQKILDERLARAEIDEEEYRNRRRRLDGR